MSDLFDLDAQRARLARRHETDTSDSPTLPTLAALQAAASALPDPQAASYLAGRSQEDVARHIADDIVPALTGQAKSSRYYGFVTGGVLPIAEWADNVVSHMDQNVQVHLPGQTIATDLEDATLQMLLGVLRLDAAAWLGRTFTTGATACNVLGMACGREAVLAKKLGGDVAAARDGGVGELGLLGACLKAGVERLQVLTSESHSSLSKAASVVGLGRQSVRQLPRSKEQPWRLDIQALEEALKSPRTASIIAVSAGDVNTGGYALDTIDEWKTVRRLADEYGAWIHVDGAFGIFARALEDKDEYKLLHQRTEGIALADSIAVDGHKLLNPYDCGMFFTRAASTLQSIFVNPNAAYLSAGASAFPSPLNIGLENSRRFRALPAYAVLLSEGRPGIARLLSNMVDISRRLAAFLRDSPHYEMLLESNGGDAGHDAAVDDGVFMIVLFRAKDSGLNEVLVDRINGTRQMYVSGTSWAGQKAVRVAVSNWKVDVERDFKVVTRILTDIAEGREFDIANC